jgi:hypothetical protein
VTVGNHIRRLGKFEDLRGFLADHAGHLVIVEIGRVEAMGDVGALITRGILKPLTLEDHEHQHLMIAACLAAEGSESVDERDRIEAIASEFEHSADFNLVDDSGKKAAYMPISDSAVRDVVVGRIGYVGTRGNHEVVVAREYVQFNLEAAGSDREALQTISVRIGHQVVLPLEQALTEVAT